MHNFKNLEIWKRSIDLSISIYSVTNSFPESEKYGLVSQLRRAAVSIASNIAEGAGRKGAKEFIHFLHIAIGSLCEVETQIIITEKLQYLSPKQSGNLIGEIQQIRKMIYGFIKNVSNESK